MLGYTNIINFFKFPNLAKKKTKKEIDLVKLSQWLNREAKKKRMSLTKWEHILAKHLRDLGYKFKMQVPIIHKTTGYIVDFLLTDYPIFIEADGKWHNTPEQKKRDNRRTKHLQKEGIYPIRLANKQISTFTKQQINDIIQLKIQMLTNVE